MELRSLQCHQGTEQIILFLQHVRLQDAPGGTMARMALDWFQLYCGVSFPVLSAPTIALPHAPTGWISILRSFLSQCQGRINLLPEWLRIPHALRQNDHFLMNAFLTLSLKPAQLQRLNYCRLYLQVENLSEICSIDGSHILPAIAWHGHSLPSTSKLSWPVQT